MGEQGWRSGESTRLPPMWPGFDSRTRRHMWVEFVVGSCLCSERFFSGYSGFPLSSKTNTSKIQFDLENVSKCIDTYSVLYIICLTFLNLDCFVHKFLDVVQIGALSPQ